MILESEIFISASRYLVFFSVREPCYAPPPPRATLFIASSYHQEDYNKLIPGTAYGNLDLGDLSLWFHRFVVWVQLDLPVG